MKKVLIVLATLFLSININAQIGTRISREGVEYPNTKRGNHFEFMGIPITGNAKSFSIKLHSKGFKTAINDDGTPDYYMFKGVFAGEESTITLLKTPITNTVYAAIASFEDFSTWIALKSKFNKLIDQYTIKYGKPDQIIKRFDYPYKEGDGYEMTAIKMDKISYIANWRLDKGSIMILISKHKDIDIYYLDDIGEKLSEKEDSNIIQNDI